MMYVSYSRTCGFNLVESEYELLDEVIDYVDGDVIDYASEFDGVILNRIKELLK